MPDRIWLWAAAVQWEQKWRGAGEGKRKLGQGVPAADSRAGKVPLLIVALNVNFQFQLGTTKRASKNNSILLPATASVPRCVCVCESVCVVVAVVHLHNSSYNQRGKQQLLFYVAAAGQWQRQRQLQFMCDDNLLLSWPGLALGPALDLEFKSGAGHCRQLTTRSC